MKHRLILMVVFLQMCTISFSQSFKSGFDSVLYEKILNKQKVERLWIYKNGNYLLACYEKNRIGIDSGNIIKKGKEIRFASKSNSGIESHLRAGVLYNHKLGLSVYKYAFQNKKNDIWMFATDQSQNWKFNPVGRDTINETEYYRTCTKLIYKRVNQNMKALREEERMRKIQVELAQKQKKEDEKIAIDGYKKAYLELTNSFLPEYSALMNIYYCGPGCFEQAESSFVYYGGLDSVFSWSHYNSEAQRLAHFDVTIHETAHKSMYEARVKCNNQLKGIDNSTNQKYKFVILNSKREFIECDYEPLPQANGMKSYIPEAFLPQEEMFFFKKIITSKKSPRLQTYIFEGNTSANVNGIYGMLDEFSAYYHGTNAIWMLYERNDTLFSKFQYEDLKNTISSCIAYYEFSLYIAWYLNYLKYEHPQKFASLYDNVNLRRVFTDLEFEFGKLVAIVENKITQIGNINDYYKTDIKSISEGLKAELENSQDILNELRIRGKKGIASR
jgi:hypothetical protein